METGRLRGRKVNITVRRNPFEETQTGINTTDRELKYGPKEVFWPSQEQKEFPTVYQIRVCNLMTLYLT